jgi:membrane protein YqaA with SNARE-associated domain
VSVQALLALFAGCLAGGVAPWVNTEILVVGTALFVEPRELALVPLVAAAGQMLGKASIYGLVRWAPDRLPARARRALARSRRLVPTRTAGVTVLLSAGIGLPPFYLVTLGAGLVHVPAHVFVGLGVLGTILRYAILAVGAYFVGGPLPLP